MPEHIRLPEPQRLGSRRDLPRQARSKVPSRNPRRHGSRLSKELGLAIDPPPPERRRDGVDPRRVFKIRTSDRLTEAADTFRKRGLRFLGESDDAVYFVIPRNESPDQLLREVAEYAAGPDVDGGKGKGKTFFDNVEAVEPYGPDDRRQGDVPDPSDLDDGETLVVDIAAWPSASTDDAQARVAEIRNACGDGAVLGVDTDARSTVVRAQLDGAALGIVLELGVVESVRRPLAPHVEPSQWLRAAPDELAPPDALDVVVGIIDDGCVRHPLLEGSLIDQRSFPDGYEFPGVGAHGTAVAGLAAFGGFEGAVESNQLPPPVRIAVAQVLLTEEVAGHTHSHLPSDQPDHVVVRAAAEWLVNSCGARVINISITDRTPFSGPHVSPLTETLDRLARELDVVIVTPSGNLVIPSDGVLTDGSHVHDDYPTYLFSSDSRLAEPAPSASALTVGSIAFSDAGASAAGASSVDEHPVAGDRRISPFSRTGPGVRAAVKPEFVDRGGDIVWTGSRTKFRDFGTEVISLHHEIERRGFNSQVGTSYAAPRVANGVGRIAAANPEASANLLRAIAGLSARPTDPSQFEDDEHQLLAGGFGAIDPMRGEQSGGPRVVMFADDEVLTDGANIHSFVVPVEFVNANTRRRIRIAVAFDPPVRRERRDYLGGHFGLDLYRGTDPTVIRAIHQEQLDPKNAEPLPGDRTRFLSKFSPNKTRLNSSTLQVFTWDVPGPRSLDDGDGHEYHLVVTHLSAPWSDILGDAYETQRYAVAIELEDLDNASVDLHAACSALLRVDQQARVRV